jgi:23S rRNA (uracil1939-C5)-methyltransferase
VHCPHAERCPGCALIGLPYPAQLEQKRALVRAAFAPYPELGRAELLPTAPAEPVTGYRVRAKLVTDGRALGLFERRSHRVVDIPDCLVLSPRLASVAASLRRVLPRLGGVSSIDLREADEGVLVTVALPETRTGSDRERVAAVVAEASSSIVTIATSLRERDSPRVLGTAPQVARGPHELRHTLEPGTPFHFASPGAFTQAHAGQAARLQQAILAALLEHARPGRETSGAPSLVGLRVLELHAGSGALGLRLARAGAELTLVENFPPAVRLSARAAEEQSLSLRSFASDAGKALEKFGTSGERFDIVLANPPRRGLEPGVRRSIAALLPELFVYVSCEPHTLARDAAHLALLGFGLTRATPFDMIPLSEAVETLALFRPAPPPPPRILYEEDAFVAVERAAHEPDGEASGIQVFARTPKHAALVTKALATARAKYLVLARGVTRAAGSSGRARTDDAGAETRPRYERLESVGGHSLLAVECDGARPQSVLRRLSSSGHPVLGDARHGDRRSNAHFEHRHGLDRAFLHLCELDFRYGGRSIALRSALAPDLARVLDSLRAET